MKQKLQIPDKKIQQIMAMPEFYQEFDKKAGLCEVDRALIPENMGTHIIAALDGVPFSSLQIPFEIYEKLLTQAPQEMSIGLLQRACTLIFTLKPNYIIDGYVDLSTLDIFRQTDKLNKHLTDLLNDAKDEAVQTIYNREQIAGRI